jgi:PIN domain nuclease of toxin-antitoxin system
LDDFKEVILLDTHVLIWLVREPQKLSRTAAEAIRTSSDGIAVSAMTLWEVAYLAASGRLNVQGTVDAFVERMTSRVAIRPITTQIAVLASQFPPAYPRDPVDKLIGATALSEGIALVTMDKKIRASGALKTIW